MYESEYSPAVTAFIEWLEANSDNPEAEIEAVKSGANIAVKNTTGSDDDFDNGLEEVTKEWEAAPGLQPKLAVNYLAAEDVEASGFVVDSNPISMRWFRLTSTPPA